MSVAYLKAYENNAAPADDICCAPARTARSRTWSSALARASRDLELAGGSERSPISTWTRPPSPRRRSGRDVLIEYYSIGAELVAFVRRGTEVELRTIAAVDEVEMLVDKLSFQIGKCALGLL